MPTPTYDLIEEKVLGSAQASVTFSSIPGTYKDLVLEFVTQQSGGTADGMSVRFNGDTGSNYSDTYLIGTGSSAVSGRDTSVTSAFIGNNWSAGLSSVFVNVMSYANTNVYTTFLTRAGYAGGQVAANACLWRSTAAVTSMTVLHVADQLASGSTFRLWGVSG